VEQEENRLKFFPIMMFAIIMGFSGITITYQRAHEIINFPSFIGTFLVYLTTIGFILVFLIYLIKFIKYPQAVKNEFSHPIRINFFASVSISLILLSIIFSEINSIISVYLWEIGIILHLFLTLYTISFWINNNQEIAHSNPAWFIPIVGNVLIPIGGIGLVSQGILIFFFSIGMFFWIILFAIIFNRIIFHHQLAVKFMPTLFILIAPPAIGFISYYKLFGVLDFFAMFLFSIAIFFTLLIVFMYKSFIGIKFFISWWAFIFPLAAMTIASLLMYKITKDISVLYLSYTMIISTTTIILVVIYQTIKNMLNHEVCIKE
jgi:tellurite resistance protein